MNWTPQKHSIVKDLDTQEVLASKGYTIVANIGLNKIKKLTELYNQYHKVNSKKGGMFYSLYSLDLKYRKTINEQILNVLSPIYNEKFENYKSVINSFIVKYNGEESAFSLHQDSTSLDENLYSPLSVWIPLQDTTIQNGCLCVIPQSQKIFYPYRGISFPTPFNKIENTLRQYLEPINMEAGDVLLFDNRLVHYSPANKSDSPRIVVMSGLFPKKATLLNCYKDPNIENAPIEIYEQEEDFLLRSTNFFHDCTARPVLGKKIIDIDIELSDFTKEMFEQKAKEYNLKKYDLPELKSPKSMNIISEPKLKESSLIETIKTFFQKS